MFFYILNFASMVIWRGGFFLKIFKTEHSLCAISMRNFLYYYYFFFLERHFSNIPIFLRIAMQTHNTLL